MPSPASSNFVIGASVAPGDSGAGVLDQTTFNFAPVVDVDLLDGLLVVVDPS